jgi:predicted lipoprotein
MRSVSLALLAAVVLMVAGCGNSDASQAQDSVSAAVSGLGTGNGKKVCDQLTAGAQKQILALLADNPLGFPDIKATSCVEGITKLHAALSQAQRNVLVDGEVGDAKVKGNKATVRVIGLGMQADLQKIGGKWMITGGLFKYAGRQVSG